MYYFVQPTVQSSKIVFYQNNLQINFLPIKLTDYNWLIASVLRCNTSCTLSTVSFASLSPIQVSTSDGLCSFGGSGVLTRHCLSLLEVIEGLGQAGSVGQDVEVVVQRVYSVPLPDCSPLSILKPRVPSRSSSAPPPAEKGKTRYCWTSW